MSAAVLTIWWITIGLALVATLIAVVRLLRVLHHCSDILELARRTAPAAEGIARNTSAIASLGAVITLAPTLLSVAGEIDAAAKTIGQTLESVAPPAPTAALPGGAG
jgi:hypothetical protein